MVPGMLCVDSSVEFVFSLNRMFGYYDPELHCPCESRYLVNGYLNLGTFLIGYIFGAVSLS